MSKITRKLIATSIFVMLVSSFIPNIFWAVFNDSFKRIEDIHEVPALMLLIAIPTVLFTLVLFSYFINKLLVKRVKNLNIATKSVIKGDYETTILDDKKDELGELATSFNEMTKALQTNEYVNKSFVRNFSHEFKTPLSTIKGYAELIDMDENLETETKEYLSIIINESNRLSNLSQNILLISQMDHQIIVPKQDTFNVTEELRKVIQSKLIVFEEKDIHFDLDVAEVTITSNQTMLYHVLLNIVDNTLKYSHKGDTLNVKIGEDETKAYLTFTNRLHQVIDEAEVFTMFYTSSKDMNKSSGVGLSLVKRIIDKLDGDVSVSTMDNTFKITIEIKKSL